MQDRITIINRCIATIDSPEVSNIASGEWFVVANTRSIYWKHPNTGNLEQLSVGSETIDFSEIIDEHEMANDPHPQYAKKTEVGGLDLLKFTTVNLSDLDPNKFYPVTIGLDSPLYAYTDLPKKFVVSVPLNTYPTNNSWGTHTGYADGGFSCYYEWEIIYSSSLT